MKVGGLLLLWKGMAIKGWILFLGGCSFYLMSYALSPCKHRLLGQCSREFTSLLRKLSKTAKGTWFGDSGHWRLFLLTIMVLQSSLGLCS